MQQQGEYVALNAPEDSERERMDLFGVLCDTASQRRIEACGIEEGWRCLEVGPGRGSMVRWLAERVGPAGQVVAADLNLRFLTDMQLPNVEVRHHDLREQDLEPQHYNLVYCRELVKNLPQPQRMVERLAAAVRSGGWLLIEDSDFGLCGAADADHPDAAAFTRTIQTIIGTFRSAGIADAFFGRRLFALVKQLGFAKTGYDAYVLLGQGGEHPLGRVLTLTFRLPGITRFVTDGVITQEEFDRMLVLLEDASFNLVGSVMFGVWARRD